MSVRVELVNAGNHPDDRIVLRSKTSYVDGVVLERGERLALEHGTELSYDVDRHGSGEACREHEAFAICVEGPGAARVRADFNPSGSGAVGRIKTLAAALINEIAASGGDPRLAALAMTSVEEGAMWGVKAATAAE